MANSVYWVGQDNNVYVKGANGVQNVGQVQSANPYGYATKNGNFDTNPQQIADPMKGNDPNSVGNVLGASTSAGTAAASPQVDPATIAAYQQGIDNVNTHIGQLDNQLNIGNQNIDTGFNSNLNKLTQAKANNQAQYDTTKQQTTQDFVTNKNTIGSNAGSSINSLQRLLGARGAGGSSAAVFNAPQAVLQEAAQQRAGAGQTFGRNNQGLDTNWNSYVQGFNNDVTDLGNQRDNQRHGLRAQIDTTRASLLNSLATLTGQKTAAQGGNAVAASQPFLDQANTLGAQADQLGLQSPVYQVNPTTYQTPSLESYTGGQFAAPQYGGSNALTDSVSPFLSLLLGNNKQKNQQPQFTGA